MQRLSFVMIHCSIKCKTMSNKEVQELAERLRDGLAVAEQRMLEEKALRNQDVIVCDDNDNIQRIPAKELIAETATV